MANFYNLIYRINTSESNEIIFTNTESYINPKIDNDLSVNFDKLKQLEFKPSKKSIENILAHLYK